MPGRCSEENTQVLERHDVHGEINRSLATSFEVQDDRILMSEIRKPPWIASILFGDPVPATLHDCGLIQKDIIDRNVPHMPPRPALSLHTGAHSWKEHTFRIRPLPGDPRQKPFARL